MSVFQNKVKTNSKRQLLILTVILNVHVWQLHFREGSVIFEHTGTKRMHVLSSCFHIIQDELRQISRIKLESNV